MTIEIFIYTKSKIIAVQENQPSSYLGGHIVHSYPYTPIEGPNERTAIRSMFSQLQKEYSKGNLSNAITLTPEEEEELYGDWKRYTITEAMLKESYDFERIKATQKDLSTR